MLSHWEINQMKISRVRIYLDTIQIINNIFFALTIKKYIEEILKRLEKKNIFFSGMCRTSYMIMII